MRQAVLNKLSKMRRFIDEMRGVTLIEIIIVLVILGIAVIPLSRLAVKNVNSGGKYATMSRAMFHAEEVMEMVIADYAAEDGSRGYDWVLTNWSGQSSPSPPPGLTGSVSISAENTVKGVTYVEVLVTVTGSDIPDVTLTTLLVDNN